MTSRAHWDARGADCRCATSRAFLAEIAFVAKFSNDGFLARRAQTILDQAEAQHG